MLLAEHELTSDNQLVERLRAKEEAACSDFVRRFYPPLHAFLLGRLGGRAVEAEQLACDVLARALQKLDSYRGAGALLNWLLVIARNEANRLFSRSRHTVFSDLPEAGVRQVESILAGADSSHELNDDQLNVVHAVMSELSESYFEVLHGKYFEGLSVAEIAGRSNRTAKAVENLLRRARAEFKSVFERKLKHGGLGDKN